MGRSRESALFCGTGVGTVTVAAAFRGNKDIVRLVSVARYRLVDGTPNTFSCAGIDVAFNGNSFESAAPAATEVKLSNTAKNVLIFGAGVTPQTKDLVFIRFDTTDENSDIAVHS